MDLSAYLEQFRNEARDQLQRLSAGLVVLEQQPDNAKVVDELFRYAHSVKGSARMMGLGTVADAAHELENTLESLRRRDQPVTVQLCDEMLAGVDRIVALLDPPGATTEQPQTSMPAPSIQQSVLAKHSIDVSPVDAPAASPLDLPSVQSLRINMHRLDDLLNLAGQLLPFKDRSAQQARALSRLVDHAQHARRLIDSGAVLNHDATSVKVPVVVINELSATLKSVSDELIALRSVQRRSALETVEAIEGLQTHVLDLRMTPVQTIYAPLSRSVRDLARESGKSVRLVVEGGDVEVDRQIVEALADPLIHLIRNAVDHGIEAPERRRALGKDPTGLVRITAHYHGGRVAMRVQDDGQGFDPTRLRRVAVARGYLSDQAAEALDDADALQLVFLPGLSTSERVSDTSGRGVGMDVVRANVERIGGRVELQNRPGIGGTVILDVPLTMAIMRVLVVEASGAVVGVPASSLERVEDLDPNSVRVVEGQSIARLGGRTRALISLAAVFRLRAASTRRRRALLLTIGDRRTALVVDDVLGEQDVVLKPLGRLLRHVPIIQGGAFLPDGRVVLVLNPASLASMRKASAIGSMIDPPSTADAPPRRRLLVVEDSITSRELERRVLEEAGFDVTTAVDGIDAIERLAAERFDAIVTDVEMPRLNGLDLTRRVRAEKQLIGVPVVIVSTRSRSEDRLAGLEAGANAYVVKSSFDQLDLVEAVRRVVG